MLNVMLKGHDFRYEIGELIKVFGLFKNINFISHNIQYDHKDDFFLINEVVDGEKKYIVSTKLIKNKELIGFDERICHKNSGIENRKELKRKIKLSIFEVLGEISDNEISWGILTGIRPTKIVHELLDQNHNLNEISDILRKEYKISNEKARLVTDVAMVERKYVYPINEDLVSIYISIPFCPTRCVYCSFPSNPVKKGSSKIEEYLNALYIEIKRTSELLHEANKMVETIYIGGGTPTTLSSVQLDELIKHVLRAFDVSRLKEFTVEAGRPDTIDIHKLQVLKENGVHRISINPQTMNERTLSLIGRQHTPEEIENAFYMAREVGFRTINMDIIIGLPNEGIEEIKNTLESIKKLSPENLTVHTLAIKRSSRLKESMEEFEMAKETLANEMLALTKSYSHGMGLYPYYMYRQKYMVGNLENVGYCKREHECIYNIQIMEEKQSIIALGAGAISKIAFPKENRLERVPNVKNVDEYIKRVDEMVERKRKQLL
jgi:oxygen-independent coproporphyrinogen-3 oxidase